MSQIDSYLDQYDQYEDEFDPIRTDRKARRSRKAKNKHIPKKAAEEVVHEIADTAGLEAGFATTYQPSKYEAGWLLSSLQSFYEQQMITDVLFQVRGGKEASVYCCAADPSTGVDLLAAKVYRPRMFRQLRNDKVYRQGREVITSDGRAVKKTDHRIMRALGKKSNFGVQVAHTSWLMHEYTTLGTLHQAGAAVPKPYAVNENAILMGYVGDAQVGAPPLSELSLDLDEALPLFREVMKNIALLLQHGMIHADLSAYNILYWEGNITIIDFPQVTNPESNPNAYRILQRDITRVCEYFARQGVRSDPQAIMRDYWNRYVGFDPNQRAVDDFLFSLESEEEAD